jgi:integrase
MSEINSTAPADAGKPAASKPVKPNKPRPDFPLGFHPAGYWCKKIRGKLHYFGPRFNPADPAATAAAADAALKEYNEKADALHSGRKPREDSGELTVKDLANRFLNAKQAFVTSGELSPRTWEGYKTATDLLVAHFGKTRLVADLDPDDFAGLRRKMAKKWGPYRLGNTIQCIRCVFKYGFDAGLLPVPMRFGPEFKRPTKKTVRLHRAGQGARLFTAEEIRKMLDAASVQMKAMLLLGINAGFGNADCGNLPLTALDLDGAAIDYPRPKTGIARRCVLWPETVAALREVLAKRKEPKNAEDAALVFVTKYGLSWAKDTPDGPVTKETRKLLDQLGINGHRNFYTLRHTFRTIADEAKDQPAADFVMGHETTHMSSVYREGISDERLRALSDYVRAWVFPPPGKDELGQKEAEADKQA